MKKTLCILSVAIIMCVRANLAESADDKKTPQSTILDPIVVTASRMPVDENEYMVGTSLLNSSKSVDIITQDDIKRSGARTVPELLKGQAGILVSDYFGNGKKVLADIRGFGETAVSNVLVMIDGRRTNQVDMSGTDWSQVNIDSIEKIEIIRGGQSVLYGDNAVGGVVNIITKKGKGSKPEIGFDYETGSYHYNSYAGHASGDAGFMSYYIGGGSTFSDGYRENSDLETDDIVNSFTLRPANYLDIKFSSGYHKDWYGQPGALTDMQIERDGYSATDDPNNRGKTEEYYIMPGFNSRFETALGYLVASADFIYRNRRVASLFDRTTYWYEGNEHTKTFGLTPRAVLKSDIFGMENNLVAGLDYYNYNYERLTSVWSGGKDSIVIKEETTGIYISDILNVIKLLTLNGGFRAEWGNFKFNQDAIEHSDNNKSLYAYAFDAGINIKYNERSAVYGNVARSFRFPAVDEWYEALWVGGGGGGLNLDLEPQDVMSYEIGVRDHTLEWLKVNADYFILDTRHEIFYDPYITYVNAVYDHTARHGLEMEAHLYPIDDLDLYGKYTYEKAFFIGSHYAGNEVPMVPRHKLAWGLNYAFMDCVDFSYVFNFVGDRRFISDQKNIMRRMKYYITNDVRMSYRKYGLEIYGAINNMFDYNYAAIGSYGQYYPSNGRNFIIGGKIKFN